MNVQSEAYLQGILNREAVDTSAVSPVRSVMTVLAPLIRSWAHPYLLNVTPSGSFAKGTANRSGTDIDLFISLHEDTPRTLKEIHDTLFNKLSENGYNPKRQNVSLNIRIDGYDVDLVPAQRQNAYSADHSLYRRRADTWTKTNVSTHISYVAAAGCISESRILKLWRDQKGLDFPSFYLELAVIHAIRPLYMGDLSGRVDTALTYLRDSFEGARLVDPANTNNIISDDLTAAGKAKIKAAATLALAASNWNQIVK